MAILQSRVEANINYKVYSDDTCSTETTEFFLAGDPSDLTLCNADTGTPEYWKMECTGGAGDDLKYSKFGADSGCAAATLWWTLDANKASDFFNGNCVGPTQTGGTTGDMSMQDRYLRWMTPLPTAPNPCSASVSGDPITSYGKRRSEFHLPVGIPFLLFQSQHMKVWGSTFPGLFGDQWLERIFVLSATDERVIDVAIKGDLKDFSRAQLMPGQLETLKITVWNPEKADLEALPSPGSRWQLEGLTLNFHAKNQGLLEDPRQECVSLASVHSKLTVCSSSAAEFLGDIVGAAWDLAHLTLDFADIHTEETSLLKGILPELWGVVPMSNKTRSYIIREWTTDTQVPEGHGTVDLNVTESLAQNVKVTV